ncbi:MAG: 50S ribosomal protein L14e [Candidatus Odinarchaeum yellowstonii]|uniref:Large ribosomal subunit protein eL14 n=1 Tax=Odinarchaeota yellowstonii (strain LCB_4) TaxID=1841599 RepID=A0AAF0IAX9_ODILC|nr:MAG: 50S ribosomal protein L14e [Candidatus Odinarchaeum yellowstonii]
MAILEVGRVCVKLYGREAGRKCVIVDVVDKNFVLVTGPKELTGVRRRRTNIKHIELTPIKVDIKKGAEDKEVLEAIQKANQTEYLKTPVK